MSSTCDDYELHVHSHCQLQASDRPSAILNGLHAHALPLRSGGSAPEQVLDAGGIHPVKNFKQAECDAFGAVAEHAPVQRARSLPATASDVV